MSTISKLVLILTAALVLSACEAPNRYPVTNEKCTQSDSVKTIDTDIADCTPPSV